MDQNEKEVWEDISIEAFRTAYKDYENICGTFSKRSKLSSSEYWILVMLREGITTQTRISEEIYVSKQTINSAIRQLCDKELIVLQTDKSNLRTKHILLTEAGEEFCKKYIDPLSGAEEEAWYTLTSEERLTYIRLLKKTNELMKQSLSGCDT